MTSKRLTIVNAVVTHLNGITVAGGYHYDVTRAAHDVRIFFDEPWGGGVLVDVIPGGESTTGNAVSEVDAAFDLLVRGAVPGTTPDGINLAGAENLLADLKNRLMDWASNATLAANCIEIFPMSGDVDGGAFAPSICEATFKVFYSHDWADA